MRAGLPARGPVASPRIAGPVVGREPLSALMAPGLGEPASNRTKAQHVYLRPRSCCAREQHIHGCVREPPQVEISVLGQPEHDIRQCEACRLYGLRPTADIRSEPLPGFVECLAENLQLAWPIRRTLNKPAGLHSESPLKPQPPTRPRREAVPVRLPSGSYGHRLTAPAGRDRDARALILVRRSLKAPLKCSGDRRPGRSIVAVVDRADPHTVVRTATLAAPFATGTAFAVSIVAMPTTGAALA